MEGKWGVQALLFLLAQSADAPSQKGLAGCCGVGDIALATWLAVRIVFFIYFHGRSVLYPALYSYIIELDIALSAKI